MDRYLSTNSKITLKGIDGHYTVKDIIGRGSSCVVYFTEFENLNGEKSEHLLKEFNPRNIDLLRKENGVLQVVNEEDAESFNELQERFIAGFKFQSELRAIEGLKNYTANIQNDYRDHGTVYIDMTVTAGESYSSYEEKSLYRLAKRIKTLSTVIGNIHKNGYLHLDIKPSNIFVRPENEESDDVLLFDFDSLVPFSDENGLEKDAVISYTSEYAPLELVSSSRRNRIGRASDIYEIGELFFEKLMGRHSTALEHNIMSRYEYDFSAPIFKNVNPKVRPWLDDLFRHTLCNTASQRYHTTDELIVGLEKIIALADPKKPFLQSFHLPVKSFFVGRDTELEEIGEELQNTDRLYICGMGGIGKSELVKQYAVKHRDCYDFIILATYITDIKSMICSIPIGNVPDQLPEEKQDDCLTRKLIALSHIGQESKILLIIDNFNKDADDEILNKLTACVSKTLITTRDNIDDAEANALKLKSIENARPIFDNYYKKKLENEDSELVDKIIAIYQNHTLATELLAKQMQASRIHPKNMYKRLCSIGLKDSGTEKIKIGNTANQNAYSYIQTIFDTSSLSEDERYILFNLSLIPPTGIPTETFHDWCGLNTYDNINSLVISGWINHDKTNDIISLHPVVADVVYEQNSKNICSYCTSLIKAIPKSKTKNSLLSMYNFFEITNYICEQLCRLENINGDIIYFFYISASAFLDFGKRSIYIICLNRAISEFEKHKIPENLSLAKLHNILARVYKIDDQFALAIKHYKTALSVNEDQSFLITIYNNLINIYVQLEQFNEAEKMYEESKKKCEKIYKEENKHLINIYSSLGALNQRKNEFEKAEILYKRSLNLSEKYFGETSVSVAHSHNNLGSLYYDLGHFLEAENEFRISLEIFIKHYGEKNVSTVNSYISLASSLFAQNKFNKAERINEKVLKLSYDVYGDNNTGTATVLNNIGQMYLIKKQYELAEKHFKSALNIWNNKFSCNHTRIAVAKQNLGVCYREQQKFDDAIETLLQSIYIYKNIYKNTNHSSLSSVYSALGKTYALMGKYDDADKHYQKALSIRRKIFEPNNDKIKLVEERIEELERLKKQN